MKKCVEGLLDLRWILQMIRIPAGKADLEVCIFFLLSTRTLNMTFVVVTKAGELSGAILSGCYDGMAGEGSNTGSLVGEVCTGD